MLRGFSAFADLTEEEFNDVLLEQDMELIRASIDNEMWNTTLQSICDYTVSSMKSAITNSVVPKLIEAGVPGVRTGVMASRAVIVQLMNDYPCLRHDDPQTALVKVIYMQWYKRQKQQQSRASSRASSRPTSRPSSRASYRSNVSVSKDNALKREFMAFKKWKASQTKHTEIGVTVPDEEEEQVEEFSEGHEEEEKGEEGPGWNSDEEGGVITGQNLDRWTEEQQKKQQQKAVQKKAPKRK